MDASVQQQKLRDGGVAFTVAPATRPYGFRKLTDSGPPIRVPRD